MAVKRFAEDGGARWQSALSCKVSWVGEDKWSNGLGEIWLCLTLSRGMYPMRETLLVWQNLLTCGNAASD